jgi:RNA polymerase sigma-70 factor (ECF subfamily)
VVDSAPRTGLGWLWSAANAARERGESDGDLLRRFVTDRDERAFAELVRRLGPTVYGVCRRHLGDTPDADDAFQATFLVLSRKGGTVNPPGKVAAWVYGVASLSARKVRHTRLRRQSRERPVHPLPDTPSPEKEMDATLLPAVDDELGRLPENFRLPIVLCGVRGLTVAQAAAELGWPVGTVASRLSRGRAELAKRLAKRGVALGVLATAGGWGGLTAAVPPRLLEQTVAAATGGTLPPAVAALSSEVSTAMTWTPIRRLTAGLLCASGLALAGGGGLMLPTGTAAPVPVAAAPGDGKTLDRVKLTDVTGLLRQEGVRKEIGLGDDEYQKLADARKNKLTALNQVLMAGIQAQVQAQGPGGAIQIQISDAEEKHAAATAEVNAEFAKKVQEGLTPAGVKRLKQAVLQARGPRVLLDRLVIRELQLSAEQEDKIDAVVGEATDTFVENAKLGKLAKARDDQWATALKVLTPDQRKKWDALVGKGLETAELLKASPQSEDSLSSDTTEFGVGGFAVPGVPVPALPIIPPAAPPPPVEEKKKEKE